MGCSCHLHCSVSFGSGCLRITPLTNSFTPPALASLRQASGRALRSAPSITAPPRKGCTASHEQAHSIRLTAIWLACPHRSKADERGAGSPLWAAASSRSSLLSFRLQGTFSVTGACHGVVPRPRKVPLTTRPALAACDQMVAQPEALLTSARMRSRRARCASGTNSMSFAHSASIL